MSTGSVEILCRSYTTASTCCSFGEHLSQSSGGISVSFPNAELRRDPELGQKLALSTLLVIEVPPAILLFQHFRESSPIKDGHLLGLTESTRPDFTGNSHFTRLSTFAENPEKLPGRSCADGSDPRLPPKQVQFILRFLLRGTCGERSRRQCLLSYQIAILSSDSAAAIST